MKHDWCSFEFVSYGLFWLLLDYFYVLLISESWSYPNFQRARLSCWLWITVLHFNYLWCFFPFLFSFKSYFRTYPCGLARGIIVTHRIWLFQTIGAGFLNEILYRPEHESRLRKWSFASFFLLVLKWTNELFILS